MMELEKWEKQSDVVIACPKGSVKRMLAMSRLAKKLKYVDDAIRVLFVHPQKFARTLVVLLVRAKQAAIEQGHEPRTLTISKHCMNNWTDTQAQL